MNDFLENTQEEEQFEDVTIQKSDNAKVNGRRLSDSRKEKKPKAPNKVETHQILSIGIKNELLKMIKENMPQLKRSLKAMLDEGDYKGYASVMSQLMKYGAPTLQAVNVEMEEGSQDSLTKKLANLIKGNSTTEDLIDE